MLSEGSVVEPDPRAEITVDCLLELEPEPEPKLRIAAQTPAPAPAPFYLPQTWRHFIEKIIAAGEVFVNYYNFNPIIYGT